MTSISSKIIYTDNGQGNNHFKGFSLIRDNDIVKGLWKSFMSTNLKKDLLILLQVYIGIADVSAHILIIINIQV